MKRASAIGSAFLRFFGTAKSTRTVGHRDRPDSTRRQAAADCPVELVLDRWVTRLLGSTKHERRVADLATDLFHVTFPLHGLGADDLRLLRWAGIVHDVGRSVCDKTHPTDGAALIKAERTLPLSSAERRFLTYLTFYHRGNVPKAGSDEILLAGDDHDRLRRLLALLRAADALDNRALARKMHAPPRVMFGLTHRAGRFSTLRVTCYLERDSAKARRIYQRRKKFRLLEQTMRCEVVPTLITPRTSRAVA